MKFLLDCTLQTIGGGIQAALSILENAARTHEHEWHVALSQQVRNEIPDRTLDALGSVRTFDSTTRLGKLRAARALGIVERTLQPDVVFTVFGPAMWRARSPHLQGFALPNVIYPKIPIPGFTSARYLRRSVDHSIRRILIRRANYLVVETHTVRNRVSRIIGVDSDRIFVVPNSFSPTFRETLMPHPQISGRRAFRFLVPSSYYHHKNLEFAALVARRMKSMLDEPVEFLFTLDPNSAAWRGILRHVGKVSVRTLGRVPHSQMAETYAQADAVFLPTLLECSSAVYPETFAAGLPLITSNRDFARELCLDGAIYIDPTDVPGTARVLADLVSDTELREALAARGRAVLARNYVSPEEKWRRQLQVLIEIAQRNRTRCPCPSEH